MSRPLQGILLQFAAMAFFVTMDALLKTLVGSHPIPQLMFVRFTVHAVVLMLVMKLMTGSLPFRSRQPLLQTLRGLTLAAANGSIAVAFLYIPLADATAVSFAAPVMTVALAAVWLGEKVSARRWFGVGLGLLGVLVVVRPPFLTGHPLHWAMLVPVVTACCNTAYQLLTRKIATVDDPRTTLLHTCIGPAILASFAQPFVWQTPAAWDWPFLLALGLLGGAGHSLLVLAYARTPVSVLAPLSYTQLLFACIAGVLVFGDWPDAWTLLGAGIIATGGVLVAIPERRPESAVS